VDAEGMAPLDDGRVCSEAKANEELLSPKVGCVASVASNDPALIDVESLPATDATEPKRGL
jgi:hypothetical protein